MTQEFCRLDLSLENVDNAMMGTAFEIVIRYSKESTDTKAGQFYTPRDIVRLLVRLTISSIEKQLYRPGRIFSIYDPCCGTGGMLTVGKEYMQERSGNPNLKVYLYGQELNQRTYAICKADLLLKGDTSNLDETLFQGDTLADDRLSGKRFNIMITNPPFGVDWKAIAKQVERETGPGQRFEAGLPDKSDGSLLFLEHLVSKMDPDSGSRIGIVLNGSPLFNGDAGSGWSNIRKMLLDRDLLDCIVRLPSSIFYGTGISTYLWILDNKRQGTSRSHHVLFIDADHFPFKHLLQRNLGMKRYIISPDGADEVVRLYGDYADATMAIQDDDDAEPQQKQVALLKDYDGFLYTKVQVDRPARLSYRNITAKYRQLLDGGLNPDRKGNTILKDAAAIDGIDRKRTDEEFFRFLADNHVRPTAADIKILRAQYGETDPDAPAIHEKPLKENSPLVADTALRDYERIPMKQDIEEYFRREVLHFVPDAWMERSKDKVGCEFPFTRLFYVYKPLRPADDILADLRKLDESSENDLQKLMED